MTVELMPRGTSGWEPPRLLRPLMGAMTRMQVRLYHRFGDRMRVQGRPWPQGKCMFKQGVWYEGGVE